MPEDARGHEPIIAILLRLLAVARTKGRPMDYWQHLGASLWALRQAGYEWTDAPHWPPAPEDRWRLALDAEIQQGLATFPPAARPDDEQFTRHHYLVPPD